MPIQCTDGTAAQAEGPFSSSIRSEVLGDELPGSSLASRGACHEDLDFNDSMTKLSVRFPPPADSEYEFLYSAPERPMEPVSVQTGLADVAGVSATSEDGPLKLLYPGPVINAAPISPEGVRGPQQVTVGRLLSCLLISVTAKVVCFPLQDHCDGTERNHTRFADLAARLVQMVAEARARNRVLSR